MQTKCDKVLLFDGNPKWNINTLWGSLVYFSSLQRVSHSYLNLFASSMKGRFCISVSSFHSAPNLLLISELCIFGFSTAILRLWPLLQTMKAFIGRLMWEELWSNCPCGCWRPFDENEVILLAFEILKTFIPSRNSRIKFFPHNSTRFVKFRFICIV